MRSTCAGRSPDGGRTGSAGAIQRAVQSPGSRRPVSNHAACDQSLSPTSVQTFTRHTTRAAEPSGSCRHGVSTHSDASTRLLRSAVQLELVPGLCARAVGKLPGQPRASLADAEGRVAEMLHAKPVWCRHLLLCRRVRIACRTS